MSILDASLRKTWDSLRARKQVQEDFLDEVRLKGLRGIRDLRVAFDYPVSVIAAPNGCGKSTVLFACAAAYAPAGRSARAYTAAALFPGFSNGGEGGFVDEAGGTALEFYYLAAGVRYSMVWRKGRSWSRGFMGRKDVRQPERELYLRTLANLTNPSEVRGLLQLGRGTFDAEEITPDQLLFARRILPQKYRGVSLIRGRNRDLLFAGLEHDNAVRYSEFHMSAGERAILRMSKDVSSLKRALILIDEIEAGLHPWTQQQLMLELQRIALRNDLQVVVTTHSPVVLDSVPPEGRIFLERDAATLDVTRTPAYRDIFQKALYGQSTDRLSILCEDEVAEGVILGVLDVLNYRNGTRHDDFVVGRDTGSDEFRGHIHAFGKFGTMAYEGAWRPALEHLRDAIRRQTGIRDYVDGEKVVHAFLAAHFSLLDVFLIHTEHELNKGYADLYLEPFVARYPGAAFGYVIEVKYLKRRESLDESAVAEKMREAADQVRRYLADEGSAPPPSVRAARRSGRRVPRLGDGGLRGGGRRPGARAGAGMSAHERFGFRAAPDTILDRLIAGLCAGSAPLDGPTRPVGAPADLPGRVHTVWMAMRRSTDVSSRPRDSIGATDPDGRSDIDVLVDDRADVGTERGGIDVRRVARRLPDDGAGDEAARGYRFQFGYRCPVAGHDHMLAGLDVAQNGRGLVSELSLSDLSHQGNVAVVAQRSNIWQGGLALRPLQAGGFARPSRACLSVRQPAYERLGDDLWTTMCAAEPGGGAT